MSWAYQGVIFCWLNSCLDCRPESCQGLVYLLSVERERESLVLVQSSLGPRSVVPFVWGREGELGCLEQFVRLLAYWNIGLSLLLRLLVEAGGRAPVTLCNMWRRSTFLCVVRSFWVCRQLRRPLHTHRPELWMVKKADF